MSRALRGAAATMLALAACACGSPTAIAVTNPPPQRPVLPQAYRPSGHMAAGDVAVRLFQWSWTDVATECESVLGPDGYRAALVSPPEEHAVLNGGPWGEHYQAVSYSIAQTTFGTGAQFQDMVQRCHAAGVDIYVDAVVNHMSSGSGTGSNGTVYTKYDYPPLYGPSDFHPPCQVTDYQNAANVQDCELLGLADLNTGLASVRRKIAGYLISLAQMGVAGFRLDAAKHIEPVELDSILYIVDTTMRAEGKPVPYYYGEVIDNPGEAVEPPDYYGLAYSSGGAADITEFRFMGVGDKFRPLAGQYLAQLDPNGPPGSQFSAQAWGLMPADKAVVFLDNHDTQRAGSLSYMNGQVYRLAEIWMLAQPYGYPIIMSSYAFDPATQAGRDAGPPPGANGAGQACTGIDSATVGHWVCEHRDVAIAGMVGFRHVTAGAPIENWWDDGSNAIAFSRGSLGFVAISRESTPVDTALATGMPAGTYCDIITGGRTATGCAGTSVVVDSAGVLPLHLDANSALAIDATTRM